jgi:hypothetical protein
LVTPKKASKIDITMPIPHKTRLPKSIAPSPFQKEEYLNKTLLAILRFLDEHLTKA